jgi:hypothetical protein
MRHAKLIRDIAQPDEYGWDGKPDGPWTTKSEDGREFIHAKPPRFELLRCGAVGEEGWTVVERYTDIPVIPFFKTRAKALDNFLYTSGFGPMLSEGGGERRAREQKRRAAEKGGRT